jgi:hypothetical protein
MRRKMIRPKPLTPYEVLTLLLSISSLISLGLIAQQVRTASEQVGATKTQTQALTTQSVLGQLFQLDDLFIKNSELRPYFYDGKEMAKEDKNYSKTLAIAEFQLDFFDSFLTQSQYLTLDDEERKNWDKYIEDSFSTSPIMCERLKNAPGWYGAKLEALARCH